MRSNRAVGDPEFGDLSNFLHPVLYYYEDPPNPSKSNTSSIISSNIIFLIPTPIFIFLPHFVSFIESVWVSGSLPYPTLYHHVVEDLLTDW